jgi:hypothetical protein
MKLLTISILSALVSSPSTWADAPPAETYERINANVTRANIQFFEDHLSKCPENEIRCVWFPNDHIKVGMLMTINLQNYSVHTVREVYDWAQQSAEARKLSHPQVESARTLLTTMPPTVENIPFGKGVHVSFWREGKLQTVTYDRGAAPLVLQRLYDIGGGYLHCTYAK